MKTTKEILRYLDAEIQNCIDMRADSDFKKDTVIKDFFQQEMDCLVSVKKFILED